MEPGLIAGIASGAGQLAGGIYGEYRSRQNAAEAHDWSVADAGAARAWMERMSSTAHQREVADLRKAGLNPILSAGKGGGAPVGGGAMAQADAPSGEDTGNFVASALEAKMMTSQAKLMKAQEEQANSASAYNKALADKTKKETSILGPKAAIFEKAEEAIMNIFKGASSGLKDFSKTLNLDKLKDSDPQKLQFGAPEQRRP